MSVFTTETETYTSSHLKTGDGAFLCSVSDRHGNMGKEKGNMFEKKKCARSFCGLGEVVEQPASHRCRRQNRNTV